MKNGLRISALIFTVLCLPALTAAAADTAAGSGQLKGVVTDKASGTPMEGVDLLAVREEVDPKSGKAAYMVFIVEGRLPQTKTDSSGGFLIPQLPVGRYAILCGFGKSPGIDNLLRDKDNKVRIFEIKEAGQMIDLGKVKIEKKYPAETRGGSLEG